MEAVASVRDLSGADIFTSRKQILDPDRQQRTKRNLVRIVRNIERPVRDGRQVNIQMIAADTDAIVITANPLFPAVV